MTWPLRVFGTKVCVFKQPQTPALQSSFIVSVGDYNNPFTFLSGSGRVYSCPPCDLLTDINTDICLFSLAPGKIDKRSRAGFQSLLLFGWSLVHAYFQALCVIVKRLRGCQSLVGGGKKKQLLVCLNLNFQVRRRSKWQNGAACRCCWRRAGGNHSAAARPSPWLTF